MNNRASRFYPSQRGAQAPRRRGGQHQRLVRAIKFAGSDGRIAIQALTALADAALIINSATDAGVITPIAADVLAQRIGVVRAALRRFLPPGSA